MVRFILRSAARCSSIAMACAVVLGVCFLLQAFTASRRLSLSWDEPIFFASGHAYLTKRDYRMNPEAPPLMQQLTALPLLALPITPPPDDDPSYSPTPSSRRPISAARRSAVSRSGPSGRRSSGSAFADWALAGAVTGLALLARFISLILALRRAPC